MKRLFLAIVCSLLMVTAAFALTFYNSNQVTLAWDAVTTDVDGDAVTGVTYRLYLVNADTDPEKTNPVLVPGGDIVELTKTITLGTKGRFYVGVQAVLDDLESVINWGDEAENQGTSELFGLRFAVPPHGAKNLRR